MSAALLNESRGLAVRERRPDAELRKAALAALLAGGGVAAVLSRPWLLNRGAGPVGMALLLTALGLASISFPAPIGGPLASADAGATGSPALSAPAVVGLGVVAVAAVRATAGPVAPVAVGAAAVSLSVLAAVAEEAFFRRFLYGGLTTFGAPVAVILSALVFAVVHIPLYGGAVFWVDFGAGLLFGWQRWASGGWAAPASTHVVANLLAVLR
jgi:membrane protease YdiL (CAAX protease family)